MDMRKGKKLRKELDEQGSDVLKRAKQFSKDVDDLSKRVKKFQKKR